MKDAFARYTNDVIASAAFGVKVDSLKHQNNEFYLMGKEATTFTILRLGKMLLSTTAPKLTKVMEWCRDSLIFILDIIFLI